ADPEGSRAQGEAAGSGPRRSLRLVARAESRRRSPRRRGGFAHIGVASSRLDAFDVRPLGDPRGRKALTEAFESPEPTAWVDFYTEDAVFVGPAAPAIAGRRALLEVAPHVSISSMEILAESTLGSGDFAATVGRASWVSGQ